MTEAAIQTLATPVPAAPLFGEPCPIRPSAETLALLANRRSSSAQSLTAPGPSAAQLQDLLRIAARAPDHGKLHPWRFIVLEGTSKAAFVERIKPLAARQPSPDKAAAVLAKLANPPTTVAVVFSPKGDAKPVWEQELSAGAVCTLMLVAAEAMGFGANWITDWYGYDPEALAILGLGPQEKLAGFIHLGTAPEAPLERVRSDLAPLVARWGSATAPMA
jgi:nitroreductase